MNSKFPATALQRKLEVIRADACDLIDKIDEYLDEESSSINESIAWDELWDMF